MPTPLDERERQELCDLLLELGPDASTSCEGWTAGKSAGVPALVGRLCAGPPMLAWRVPDLHLSGRRDGVDVVVQGSAEAAAAVERVQTSL